MIISSGRFEGLSVNCGLSNQFFVREDILKAIYDRLFFMVDNYSRVMILRYDLRFPYKFRYKNGDESLQRFINSFTTFIKRKNCDYHYVWVKEQNASDNVHYHCVFLVDPGISSNSLRFDEKAKDLWSISCSDEYYTAPLNLVHVAQRRLDNNCYLKTTVISKYEPYFEDTLADCFYWLSYLAKVNSKIINPGRGNRGWGSSLFRMRHG